MTKEEAIRFIRGRAVSARAIHYKAWREQRQLPENDLDSIERDYPITGGEPIEKPDPVHQAMLRQALGENPYINNKCSSCGS